MYNEKIKYDIQSRNEKFFENIEPNQFIKDEVNTTINPFIEYHREKQFRLMLKYLRPKKNDKILVIGIGKGREIEVLLNFANKIYGLDISKKFINYCEEKFGNRFKRAYRICKIKS